MRLRTIEDDDEFLHLEKEWDNLLEASRQDNPFLRHNRVHSWWRTFAGEDRLHVVAASDDAGRLVGVLPAFVTRNGRMAAVRTLRFLGADIWIGCAGLTAFAHPACEDEVFDRFASYVRGGRGWDVMDFGFMDATSPLFTRLTTAPGKVRIRADSDYCPSIPLPVDWDTYLETLSRNARGNLRRTIRRAEDRGMELEVVNEPSALPAAIDDLVRLLQARLSQLSEPLPDAYGRFAALTIPALLAEGRLRLMFLRLDGRRLAAFHGWRYRDTVYMERTGFEDQGQSTNIMRPLLGMAIRAAIEEGAARFDMMNGAYGHKIDWGATDLRRLSRLRRYRSSPVACVSFALDEYKAWQRSRRVATDETVVAAEST